jgi:hypothetical protein
MTNIDATREYIAAKMLPTNGDLPTSVIDLADHLTSLATAEGREHMAADIEHALAAVDKGQGDVNAVAQYVLTIVAHGSDDTYSGRGNDLRRARHDGVVREAEAFFRAYLTNQDYSSWR